MQKTKRARYELGIGESAVLVVGAFVALQAGGLAIASWLDRAGYSNNVVLASFFVCFLVVFIGLHLLGPYFEALWGEPSQSDE